MYPEYPYLNYKDENVRTPITFPGQHQNVQPGIEASMNPHPIFENSDWVPSNKLQGKVAIITGGDSGIRKSSFCFVCQRRGRYCNCLFE